MDSNNYFQDFFSKYFISKMATDKQARCVVGKTMFCRGFVYIRLLVVDPDFLPPGEMPNGLA